MAFNFGVLPNVLFKPKEAFKELGAQTIKEGLMLAAVFSVVSNVISGAVTGQFNVLFWVVAAVMAVVTIYAMGWLAAQIAKMVFKGSGNVRNTIGYLAYGQVLGVVSAVVFAVLSLLGMGAVKAGANMMDVGALMGAASILGIVGLVLAVWGLYIMGAAVGRANGIRVLFGAVCGLVASLIVGLIVGMIFATVLGALGMGALLGAGALAATQ